MSIGSARARRKLFAGSNEQPIYPSGRAMSLAVCGGPSWPEPGRADLSDDAFSEWADRAAPVHRLADMQLPRRFDEDPASQGARV